MLGMSNEQLLGLVRQVLPVLGGIAVTFGWLTADQVAGATATILQILGPLMIVGSTIWSLVNKTKANLVSTVAAMPEVKRVELKQTHEAAELERSTPPNVAIPK